MLGRRPIGSPPPSPSACSASSRKSGPSSRRHPPQSSLSRGPRRRAPTKGRRRMRLPAAKPRQRSPRTPLSPVLRPPLAAPRNLRRHRRRLHPGCRDWAGGEVDAPPTRPLVKTPPRLRPDTWKPLPSVGWHRRPKRNARRHRWMAWKHLRRSAPEPRQQTASQRAHRGRSPKRRHPLLHHPRRRSRTRPHQPRLARKIDSGRRRFRLSSSRMRLQRRASLSFGRATADRRRQAKLGRPRPDATG